MKNNVSLKCRPHLQFEPRVIIVAAGVDRGPGDRGLRSGVCGSSKTRAEGSAVIARAYSRNEPRRFVTVGHEKAHALQINNIVSLKCRLRLQFQSSCCELQPILQTADRETDLAFPSHSGQAAPTGEARYGWRWSGLGTRRCISGNRYSGLAQHEGAPQPSPGPPRRGSGRRKGCRRFPDRPRSPCLR
jgi:hypothetical protein